MAFPPDIMRLSEMVADKIVGALYKTAEAGARIEILQEGLSGVVKFFTGHEAFVGAHGKIEVQYNGDPATGGSTLIISAPQHDGAPGAAPFVALRHGVDGSYTVFPLGIRGSEGRTFVAWDGGHAGSVSLSAVGEADIPHTLGQAPDSVTVTNTQNNGRTINVVGKAFDVFTIQGRDPAGALLAGGTVIAFDWQAVVAA